MKKKLLFWIDSSLYNFFNAKLIHEQLDCEIYSIYDITDKPKVYFKSQKVVNFSSSWFFHEHVKKPHKNPDLNYLSSFEKKFQINLWKLAYNERNFYQFNKFHTFKPEEILSILEKECKFFEKILDDIKPDFLILPQPFFHQDHILYKMCKKLKISTLLVKTINSKPQRCMIKEYDEYTPVEFSKKSIMSENFQELRERLNPSHFKSVKKVESTNYSEKFSALLKFIFSSNENTKSHYTYYGRTKTKVLYTTFLLSIKEKIRANYLEKNSIKKLPENNNFIYFPMHQEEEESLLIGAPFFTNQIDVIKNIIRSLPIGYQLYVKESPVISQRDGRKISDYKQLLDLPNLKLIHPSISPNEILKKCSMVITIVGSTGLEAAYYKKPSITLVDTHYGNLSSVKKLKNFDELPSLINQVLNENIDYSDIFHYHDYLESNSFHFNFYNVWNLISNYFHFGGAYVDVQITDKKMNTFLETYSDDLKILSNEYVKKIQNCIELNNSECDGVQKC